MITIVCVASEYEWVNIVEPILLENAKKEENKKNSLKYSCGLAFPESVCGASKLNDRLEYAKQNFYRSENKKYQDGDIVFLHTGVGKVRSACELLSFLVDTNLWEFEDDNEVEVQFINIGLAGGYNLELGEIVEIAEVIEGDFDTSVFDKDFEYNRDIIDDSKLFKCCTRDTVATRLFVDPKTGRGVEVYDMELYALTHVIRGEGFNRIKSIKMISDLVGEEQGKTYYKVDFSPLVARLKKELAL